MSIRHEKTVIDDRTVIVHLQEKELVQRNAPEVKQLLLEQLAAGHRFIILDLSEVKDVDSSGLGAFLFGKRQANAREGDLFLLKANEKIQSLIRIAQLTQVLEPYETVDAILQQIQDQE